MRRKALALGLATTLAFTGCSTEGKNGGESEPTTPATEQVAEVTIRNILGVKIDMSDNPSNYSPANKRGEIAAGATATATCIVVNEGSPDQSKIFVRNAEGDEGFISIVAGGGKEEEPLRQVEPGYEELKHLPPCGDAPTDA
jgi:hypothetical protein